VTELGLRNNAAAPCARGAVMQEGDVTKHRERLKAPARELMRAPTHCFLTDQVGEPDET
jgi:hypothetical protein